ncbi:hypothetical protein RB595_005890 [Gaeumannomyces hyphopodioides]
MTQPSASTYLGTLRPDQPYPDITNAAKDALQLSTQSSSAAAEAHDLMTPSEVSARLRCRSDVQAAPHDFLAERLEPDAKARSSNNISGASQPPRRSARLKRLRRRRAPNLFERRWSLPLLLVLLVVGLYAAHPAESNVAGRLLFLSYGPGPGPGHDAGGGRSPSRRYGKGPWDLAFVAFYTVLLTFTREFCMQELLRPLARSCGITSPAKQARFMEQTYTVAYIAFAGPFGMWCMRRTPAWYFDTRGMYESYPDTAVEAPLKFYYLFQAAFWVQQAMVMVLGLEKRRKDFKELVAHHIVTIFLIALSYRFHFTHAGIAVYVTHDLSDMVLAMSKSLNYIGSPLQIPCFAVNIATWIYLRHYINIRILYSILTEFQTVGPFQLDWQAGQYKCRTSQVIIFGLLAALQLLNIFWLFCLFRAAYRILFRGIAKDDRSQDEDTATNDAIGERTE